MSNLLREIKQSLRLYMNGVTAQSLREKGLNYHLNWGASLQHLQEMAAEIREDVAKRVSSEPSDQFFTLNSSLFTLSSLLWKENIRECKILATMLMPPKKFPADLAMLWVEQTPTQEIAEMAAMNLYRHLPYAKDMAFQLIAQPYEMAQLQGYCILARLFTTDAPFTDSEINEFIDQAHSAFQSSITHQTSDIIPQTSSISLRHTILNAVTKLDQRLPELNITPLFQA
jgi:hypothetical protein